MCSSWRWFSRWMTDQISGSTEAMVDWARSNMIGSPSSAEDLRLKACRHLQESLQRACCHRLPRRTAETTCPHAAGHLVCTSRWFTTSGPKDWAPSPVAQNSEFTRRPCEMNVSGRAFAEQGDLLDLRLVVRLHRHGRRVGLELDRLHHRRRARDVDRHDLAARYEPQMALFGQHLAGVAAVVREVARAHVVAQPGFQAAGTRDALLEHLGADAKVGDRVEGGEVAAEGLVLVVMDAGHHLHQALGADGTL